MQNDISINKSKAAKDLPDSPKDKKEMQEPESFTINLPEVKDIPGQENIVPAPLGELADETISSSDEEGDGLFDDDTDNVIGENKNSNVTAAERKDLRTSANNMPDSDDMNLREAALDNTDNDGTPLNEGSFKNNISATDLDIPGTDEDDEDEEIGEEDEENNDYSLGGDNHDDIPEDEF